MSQSLPPLKSKSAIEAEKRRITLKYKRLFSIVNTGMPCAYTKEQLEASEAKEWAIFNSRLRYGKDELPASTEEPSQVPVELNTKPVDLVLETPSASVPILEAPPVAMAEVATMLHSQTGDALVVNDLQLPPPNHKCELRPFQESACQKILTHLLHLYHHADLLQAGVGTGKTFMVGSLISRLRQIGWEKLAKNRDLRVYPAVIWVTKATIVEKTQRDLLTGFGLTSDDVLVTNYDQLRATLGKHFFRCKTVIVKGEPEIVFEAVAHQMPCLIVWDEAHSLKNSDSQQSKIAQCINDLLPKDRPYQLFMSATIGTRLRDFKCFSAAAGYCSNSRFNEFIGPLCTKGDPNLRSRSAMKRFMDKVDAHVIRVPAINGKYRAFNRVMPVKFLSLQDQQHSEEAFARYAEKKTKLNQNMPGEHFMRLVAFNEYRRETEPLRAPILARLAHEAIQKGRSVVIPACFKVTLVRTLKILVKDYGYTRDQISMIWGGDDLEGVKELTSQEMDNYLRQVIQGIHVPNKIIKQIYKQAYPKTELDDEFKDYDFGDLRLGLQTRTDRQREIDRFQTGRTIICMFTYASGGVGLSLHDSDDHFALFMAKNYMLDHTDEHGRKHWRHLRSGKVYCSRPRETFASPTFSGQEFVQGLGRAHRSIFSLSDTYQHVIFFQDSVEESVMEIVSANLNCLTEAVRGKESWQDAMLKPRSSAPKQINTDFVESTLQETDSSEDEDDDGEEVD